MSDIMRRLSAPILATAVIALSAGFSSANSIVGTWRATAPGTSSGAGPQIAIVFDSHHRMTETMQGTGVSIIVQSTYKIDNDQLTQTLQSLSVNGKKQAGAGRTMSFFYKIAGNVLTLRDQTGRGNMVLTRMNK